MLLLEVLLADLQKLLGELIFVLVHWKRRRRKVIIPSTYFSCKRKIFCKRKLALAPSAQSKKI